jgi:hypothetical protein
MTDIERPPDTVPADHAASSAAPDSAALLRRERTIYLIAPLLLLINRGLIRFPHLIFPPAVLENESSWYYVLGPAFSWVALIYCMFATWRFFEFAGVSRWASILNGIASPFLFPLILLPQAIYVLRRASKRHQVTNVPATET